MSSVIAKGLNTYVNVILHLDVYDLLLWCSECRLVIENSLKQF